MKNYSQLKLQASVSERIHAT